MGDVYSSFRAKTAWGVVQKCLGDFGLGVWSRFEIGEAAIRNEFLNTRSVMFVHAGGPS
jgi:hypothetical protein